MSEQKPTVSERLSDQYDRLLKLEPKLVTNYVPSNAADQKREFLDGAIRNPNHEYPKLDEIDFPVRERSIEQVGSQILNNPTLKPKHAISYEQFVMKYQAQTKLMELARQFNAATDQADRERIGHEYMNLNIELYGKPDEATFRSLLQERLEVVGQKELTGRAAELRQELFDMAGFDASIEKLERFRPQPETVEWAHGIAETLYGGMLEHVPDQVSFSETEVQQIFLEIIREEFGEAAKEWTVDIVSAKSITVKSAEKRIVIPNDRGNITKKMIRELIVHEIGIHMLRSVIGNETDLDPLKNGLADYFDAEEGLGVVMQQALNGQFQEAGINHYITAGLAYYDHKDFRDIYELKWRLALLDPLHDGEEIIPEMETKAKNTAYGGVMRIMRGTDELPWFKDLSYYNGSVDVWRHLESIRGDDTKFMFVLMGKADPANLTHERIQYETATA